ncbi:MAG: universal stress protein [Candidatus Obscuribacterales bacterium]|nr:universal stress protein [Candidatus Obscuribacterales bacterium]
MKILLPVDSSIYSRSAIETLVNAEWLSASEILLVTVVRPIESLLAVSLDEKAIAKEQEIITEKSNWLMEIAESLKRALPACRIDYRVKFGDIRETIIQTAIEEGFELVVMGSHGKGTIERLLIGSVAQCVLEHAPTAIMIVKRHGNMDNQKLSRFEKILVPYDGSVYSGDTVSWLSRRVFSAKTKFHIVMAIPEFEEVEQKEVSPNQCVLLDKQWHTIKERSFEILENIALKLGSIVGNENVSIDAVPGDPQTAILKAAERFGADLIACGSHGRSGLSRLLIGSVSMYLVHNARCPVLVLKRLSSSEPPSSDTNQKKTHHTSEDKARKRSISESTPPFSMM